MSKVGESVSVGRQSGANAGEQYRILPDSPGLRLSVCCVRGWFQGKATGLTTSRVQGLTEMSVAPRTRASGKPTRGLIKSVVGFAIRLP